MRTKTSSIASLATFLIMVLNLLTPLARANEEAQLNIPESLRRAHNQPAKEETSKENPVKETNKNETNALNQTPSRPQEQEQTQTQTSTQAQNQLMRQTPKKDGPFKFQLPSYLAESCGTASFRMTYVGEGQKTVMSGNVTNSSITIPAIPNDKEGLVTFTCVSGETPSCLVRADDNNLLCNESVTIVMESFQGAIGKTILDPLFSAKTLSKTCAIIAQITQSDESVFDVYKKKIANCKSLPQGNAKKSCYKSIIDTSPFAGIFNKFALNFIQQAKH